MKAIKHKPKSLDEAIGMVLANIEPGDRYFIQLHDAGIVHHSFGMYLRNEMGLWRNRTLFKKDIKKRFGLFGHGDDCSGLILAAVWAKVRDPKCNVARLLKQEAAGYKKHWKQSGVDPATGRPIKICKK